VDTITFGRKENQAIVFLHGWGGGFSSFSFFAKSLSDEFYCVVCDFSSDIKSGRVLSVVDFAQALYDKLGQLGLNSVTLVGHSFGGRVAAKFCFLYPKMIKKVVLVDSAGLRPRRKMSYYIKVWWFKFLKKLSKKGLISQKKLSKFGSLDYNKLNDIEKETFKNIVNEDLAVCFESISASTLIFWGGADRETPPYMAKKLNKLIQNSALIIVNQAGHFSYLDAPAQFISAIRSFMENKNDKSIVSRTN